MLQGRHHPANPPSPDPSTAPCHIGQGNHGVQGRSRHVSVTHSLHGNTQASETSRSQQFWRRAPVVTGTLTQSQRYVHTRPADDAAVADDAHPQTASSSCPCPADKNTLTQTDQPNTGPAAELQPQRASSSHASTLATADAHMHAAHAGHGQEHCGSTHRSNAVHFHGVCIRCPVGSLLLPASCCRCCCWVACCCVKHARLDEASLSSNSNAPTWARCRKLLLL